MNKNIIFIMIAIGIALNVLAEDGVLTFATWNIANLHSKEGFCTRIANPPKYPQCSTKRNKEAFDTLRKYVQNLNADVIALQEIHSPEAVSNIFGDEYVVHISGRYDEDKSDGKIPCPKEGCVGTDGIYTAIAIKKGMSVERLPGGKELSLLHLDKDGKLRPTRWAVGVEIKNLPVPLKFYSIHLKSSCHSSDLIGATKEDCKTLTKQIPALEKIIDEDISYGYQIVVAGDFNRRIAYHRSGDELWSALDDHSPSKEHNLKYVPYLSPKNSEKISQWWKPCTTVSDKWWAKKGPIDYIVFSTGLSPYIVFDSAKHHLFSQDDANKHGRKLSDHCPISVNLRVSNEG